MTTPYVPLLLPYYEVKMLQAFLAGCLHEPEAMRPEYKASVAGLAEIKHKLDDALKQLGIVSKETPGQ